jgi:excisionase family DNA binding protein
MPRKEGFDVERLLQPEEVAEILGVTKRYVQDLVYAGKLGCVRIGRKVRVPESTLADFVKSRTSIVGVE